MVTVSVNSGVAEDSEGSGNTATEPALSNFHPPALILSAPRLLIEEGSSQTYTVALSVIPDGAVTVSIASDSEIVTVTPETLDFTTSDWNRPKTITVTTLRDEDDEAGPATLSHSATGSDYAGVTGTVIVTVTKTSVMPATNAFLPRFGRAVGQQSVEAVAGRLRAVRSQGLAGQLAGYALPASNETSVELTPSPERMEEETGAFGTLTGQTLLSGTSFALTGGESGGASRTLWAQGMYSGFESEEGGLKLDTEVTGFLLGMDWKRDTEIFGLMISQSEGEGEYRLSGTSGEIESSLTALIPYLGWTGENGSGWVSLGIRSRRHHTVSQRQGFRECRHRLADVRWRGLRASGQVRLVRRDDIELEN